ncbi:MAG: MlaD family protein [Candidatus Zapsychrus exili]|nr:MlaD family protein [Candidatus Zapsychrus exili]
MRQRRSNKAFFTGMFFILGLFLILTVIFTIGENQGLIKPKFKVEVLFGDVGGLIEGAPVRLAGVFVGSVNHINFLKEEYKGKRVKVALSIFSEYRNQLDKSARFVIVTDGILGEKLVVIDVDGQGKPLDLDEPIMGEEPMDVQDLAEVFSEAAESFTKTSDELSKINFKDLSVALEDTAKSLVKTSEGVNVILGELSYITKKTKRLLDRIEQRIIDGNLFKVF